MNSSQIADALRARMEALGLTVRDLADRAQCRVLDVDGLLAGDPAASVQTLVAVSEVVGYVVLTVPGPARAAFEQGLDVTEPAVETKVSRALKSIPGRAR